MSPKCDLIARTTPIGWLVSCKCGFRASGTTRNALGRRSAMDAALREHARRTEEKSK